MKHLVFFVALTLSLTTSPARSDDRGNPLESWRCGKVVVNYNQLRSDAYEWEFVGELPAKGRLSFVYEDHGNSVDLNGEGCDRIKKGEEK
jgi:hypothetical protein